LSRPNLLSSISTVLLGPLIFCEVPSTYSKLTALQSLSLSGMVAEPNWNSCWILCAGTPWTMSYVRRNYIYFRLLCWNQLPWMKEVKGRHTEADKALWYRHR
jgi:hypothetical protein